MKKIISVSRRTDIPAFYGDWFLNRVKAGFVPIVNPYSNKNIIVSLKEEDVSCFVFWSKNYKPFLPMLEQITDLGYNSYFNYTITGLPDIFECNLCDLNTSINTIKLLSKMYSPKYINWRYDPIVLSNITDYEYHLNQFRYIASQLDGYVERCYFSFVSMYGKVQKSFTDFENNTCVKFQYDKDLEIKLANELAWIAKLYDIQMYACSSDYLVSENIKKAHCIDGELINTLFKNSNTTKQKPTRLQCGCFDSTDIGTYDSCPHGCIYCYANINKDTANSLYSKHDANSAFLGYTKEQSDIWLKDMELERIIDTTKINTFFDI